MQTQVHFSGIREAVVGLIDAARHSVLVATAALSDRTLFDALVAARRRGLAVSLALCDDAANRESIIAWERLSVAGGSIFWIEAGSARAAALQQRKVRLEFAQLLVSHFCRLQLGSLMLWRAYTQSRSSHR